MVIIVKNLLSLSRMQTLKTIGDPPTLGTADISNVSLPSVMSSSNIGTSKQTTS